MSNNYAIGVNNYYTQISLFETINTNNKSSDNKSTRKKLMDKVKEFVDYAYNSGSKNCAMYYISFSNLVKNKDLRIVYPIIYEKIDTGIKRNLSYKEIYKNCSKEVRLIPR